MALNTEQNSTHMLNEAAEIADRVGELLSAEIVAVVKPCQVYTLARGSSDHAATVIQRLMNLAGIAAFSFPPSAASSSFLLPDSAALAISQSGASPDLVQGALQCKAAGSHVLALVNTLDSELARTADTVIDQAAGPELAVAATKSVVCSIVAGARLANLWGAKLSNLHQLPEQIRTVQRLSFVELETLFADERPLLIIGRGSGLGVAQEIALKVQELLGRPAFGYSSAEVLHGPAGMIVPGFPVLALCVGEEKSAVLDSVEKLRAMGADVTVLDADERQDHLSATVLLSWVYFGLEAACRKLGKSPDKPDNLSKVTLTT